MTTINQTDRIEHLANAIEHAVAVNCVNSEGGINRLGDLELHEIASYLRMLRPIPVGERLPHVGTCSLAWISTGDSDDGFWSNAIWKVLPGIGVPQWTFDEQEPIDPELQGVVTHWLPLPPAPDR